MEKYILGIPAVKDLVVQTPLKMVIEPLFENEFVNHSYGFRPLRGCKLALREVDGCLKAGQTWVVDADLKSYFDTIPHAPLMAEVEKLISDGKILKRHCRGNATLCRYADDFVCCFERVRDAQRFYEVLPKRLAKFGLEVAGDKIQLLHFHRGSKSRFCFLGFEFYWGRSRDLARPC